MLTAFLLPPILALALSTAVVLALANDGQAESPRERFALRLALGLFQAADLCLWILIAWVNGRHNGP